VEKSVPFKLFVAFALLMASGCSENADPSSVSASFVVSTTAAVPATDQELQEIESRLTLIFGSSVLDASSFNVAIGRLFGYFCDDSFPQHDDFSSSIVPIPVDPIGSADYVDAVRGKKSGFYGSRQELAGDFTPEQVTEFVRCGLIGDEIRLGVQRLRPEFDQAFAAMMAGVEMKAASSEFLTCAKTTSTVPLDSVGLRQAILDSPLSTGEISPCVERFIETFANEQSSTLVQVLAASGERTESLQRAMKAAS
jgi:hypothetical protein